MFPADANKEVVAGIWDHRKPPGWKHDGNSHMDKGTKISKVILYQNLGFLTVIALGFVDEMTRMSALVFGDAARHWEFRHSTLGMLLVLAVWFLVSMSTRRILDRLHYLEKFIRVCAWCHHINFKSQWITMEEFLRQGFDTPTTHGICPTCLAEQKAAIVRAKEKRETAAVTSAS
jgi:hypothetical protein